MLEKERRIARVAGRVRGADKRNRAERATWNRESEGDRRSTYEFG